MTTIGRLVLIAIVMLATLAALTPTAEAQTRRVALVIGNAAYALAPKLGSPVQDAAAVETRVRSASWSDYPHAPPLGPQRRLSAPPQYQPRHPFDEDATPKFTRLGHERQRRDPRQHCGLFDGRRAALAVMEAAHALCGHASVASPSRSWDEA